MYMSIQLKAANGAICTLSLSFNNDGPLGTFFRYISGEGREPNASVAQVLPCYQVLRPKAAADQPLNWPRAL